MEECLKCCMEVAQFLKGSFLEIYIGLRRIKVMKGEDPDKCVHAIRAGNLFLYGEDKQLENFIKLCRSAVEHYDAMQTGDQSMTGM